MDKPCEVSFLAEAQEIGKVDIRVGEGQAHVIKMKPLRLPRGQMLSGAARLYEASVFKHKH